MNDLDEGQMMPSTQTFLYGCVLEAGKEVVFNPEDDDFEHQLDLRMACVDPSTKDEIHMVEVEGQDLEGQKVKAVLVSLKPSTLPSLCLGGFTITPPAVFRLKAGAGPIHISGQHLVLMEGDQSFDEDDDEEEEEDESLKASKKRPASTPAGKSQKKIKVDTKDTDEDDEDDEEDEEEGDEEEESEEEESPVKAKATPSKAPAQNGKSPKPKTPAPKQAKTPDAKGDKTPKGQQSPKTPKGQQTPKTPLTIADMKVKMMDAIKKGVTLPKLQPKFENYVKNGFRVSDPKDIAELWKWRQTVKEAK